jgi:hypothetical protein
MKGAVNQFWLPEILGSSPRLEQENDMARALHAAMRVCFDLGCWAVLDKADISFDRFAFLTMLRYAQG